MKVDKELVLDEKVGKVTKVTPNPVVTKIDEALTPEEVTNDNLAKESAEVVKAQKEVAKADLKKVGISDETVKLLLGG